MTTSERNAAADLAKRIEVQVNDPALVDEAKRPPEDRPPKFADALMTEKTGSIEHAADLNDDDWVLIGKALEHYAGCKAA